MANGNIPSFGEIITIRDGRLHVPDNPTIPYIEGDGIGPEVWTAACKVLDAAVQLAYNGRRQIHWLEVLAGEKSFNQLGTWLPDETLQAFTQYLVGVKGPLTTPIGGGFRSLNVALRKELDLYACVRPVRWFRHVPSTVVHPEDVSMVTFRENTEDVYTGIEFQAGSPENERFKRLLQENFPDQFENVRFPETSAFGLKPISKQGSERLIRAAIRWALENRRRSVTLVHKGNIMKFTEGAFRNWGYALAEREFGERIYTRRQWEATKATQGESAANAEQEQAISRGRLLVKDVIADIVFEQTITIPREFDVFATMNLNGDYLSDALAAQVGGIGMAPGGNINFETGVAVFEATHGTAPTIAGQDKANPSSLILSGEMMLRYLGWNDAAELVVRGLELAIEAGTVTFDLYRAMDRATLVGTQQFAVELIHQMEKVS